MAVGGAASAQALLLGAEAAHAFGLGLDGGVGALDVARQAALEAAEIAGADAGGVEAGHQAPKLFALAAVLLSQTLHFGAGFTKGALEPG
ncbi:hypothetical protein D9M71_749620 [compost metagenome]